jgi:hypothetical protein
MGISSLGVTFPGQWLVTLAAGVAIVGLFFTYTKPRAG